MKYQLVLQWPASSIDDYDELIGMENALVDGIGEGHEVDGHDAGSGEMNIFILTDDPVQAFDRVRAILGSPDRWEHIRVAYRGVSGGPYVVLWPPDLSELTVR
jgi:hypothetical protein